MEKKAQVATERNACFENGNTNPRRRRQFPNWEVHVRQRRGLAQARSVRLYVEHRYASSR
jgi:hypothetical protein